MKLFTKTRVFLDFHDKQGEVEANAVEVRQGTVFIHPIGKEVIAIRG